MSSNGTASGTVSLPATSQLVIRAKGDQYNGAPAMTVSLDGKAVATVNVASTSWADYTVPVTAAAGTHTVSIAFTNDAYAGRGKDRNLRIDRITAIATPVPPTVSITDVSVAEGNSGTTNANFAVSLSKLSTTAVTVGYATADATGTAGVDYTPTSGTLTFAPGVTSQTINVNVIGDTTVEPNETFTVTLSNPTGATLARGSATGTITNDDVAPSTINVKDYGAVGNGVHDDSAAIKAATAALTSGQRLYLPAGDYRFAQQNPADGAAIFLNGLSNVTVEFDPNARLLMDNLASNGTGTGYGIRIEGASSNVTILNPTIDWTTRPSARSFGDGISVLGWPSDTPPPAGWTGSTGTVSNITITNADIVNAPQTGVVVMGASDVTINNLTVIGTLADGLHLNANRRVTVDGLVAQNTGDDGLAFVTYYHPSQPWTYGPTDGPFNQAGLGEWNNSGSTATNITVSGGRANGVRVQGGNGITISHVAVSGKDAGIQVNSAIATGPGDWTSLASRNISISDVTIDNTNTGVVLATNNINGTEDPIWWNFSGVTISNVNIRNSQNWSLSVETPATTTSKLAGVTLSNITATTTNAPTGGGNGGILLASLQNSTINNINLTSAHNAEIDLLGAAQLRSSTSVNNLPPSNDTVNGLTLNGPGRILIQDITGIKLGNLTTSNGGTIEYYRTNNINPL